MSRLCRSASKCKRCHGRHHTTICDKNSQQPVRDLSNKLNPKASPYSPDKTNNTPTTTTFCSAKRKSILLQTALTVVHNPRKPKSAVQLRILFDTGSQRSYLTKRAMKLLQLKPIATQTLSIATFGAEKEQSRVCPVVSVGICLRERSTMTLSLYVVPSICEPIACQPVDTCVTADEHLMCLDLADPTDGTSQLPVDLLIGCDYYWDLVTGSICRTESGPTAIHTKLGWVLSGPTLSSGSTRTHTATTHQLRVDCQVNDTEPLEDQLRAFWEIESFGISQVSQQETLYEQFTSDVSLTETGRYQVSLPWKEFHKPLCDNYVLSHKRLQGLLKRLKHEPKLMKEYDTIIKDQLGKGIIEPVDPNDKTTNLIHYLPHHGVIRLDKSTTKLRVVYDALAKSSGPSLNECLYKGPKFQQLVFDLLRFRSYPVALTADVEKAFLMIMMDEKDRDVLRFLCMDSTFRTFSPDVPRCSVVYTNLLVVRQPAVNSFVFRGVQIASNSHRLER